MVKYFDKIAVTNFYSFVPIEDPDVLQAKMLLIGKKKGIKGTILIASEGFNGAISGPEEVVREVFEYLCNLTGAEEFMYKINYCSQHPFAKYKVRLKKEIVTLGIGELDVNNLKGEYITSEKWDEYLAKEDTILIDTRNDYEVAMGTFKSSIDPLTPSFRDFPAWVNENKDQLKDKVILMCCTGGIRCEKSTAYMKSIGYEKVYHLKGGILQYLEDTNNQNQMWQGDCFVFDDRIAVDDQLKPNVANAPEI